MNFNSFLKPVIVLLLPFVLIPIQYSYGHGIGFDTTSIDHDGREIKITIELPMNFEESQQRTIKINAYDEKAKENAKNVTFLMGLYKDDNLIFRNYFFTPDGNLFINVTPDTQEKTKIIGGKDSLLGAWYGTESQPIELVGPVFDSGGLFHFEVELRTIDEKTNIVEGLGTHVADVSVVETTKHIQKDLEGNEVTFRTKSYFDKISNFHYNPEKELLTFAIPFDWKEKVISHIPVVHEEVHFPKDFEEFNTPSYIGKVNGIELFKSNVIVDDYTEEDERIVHFVILKDHLKFLKGEQQKRVETLPKIMNFSLESSEKIEFPMIAMTRDERFQIDLSWDPIEIEPNTPTDFVFTIRDGNTGSPLRQSSYDFVILQNNVELYRTSGTAEVGGDFEQFTFSEDQSGPTIIRFENIRGTGLSTEFGIVVIPEFGSLVLLTLVLSMAVIIFGQKIFRKNIMV